jgi:pyruvate/2-oxoglutarate dehydrogenase complex dihydrolipoamide acyltransferase (E2) component
VAALSQATPVREQVTNGNAPYASPSIRRLARQLDVDLTSASGSGRKARITRTDVEALIDSKRAPAPAPPSDPGFGLDLLPWPSVDFEKFGPVERAPRTRIQKISAPNLARNWVMIPHVTHNDEADILRPPCDRRRRRRPLHHPPRQGAQRPQDGAAVSTTEVRVPDIRASPRSHRGSEDSRSSAATVA